MHILITGAGGMIGRKLTARLAAAGGIKRQPIDPPTPIDVRAPAPAPFRSAAAGRPDVIFHLAAIVSGEAELDFEKGMRVNLDGSRALLEAVRAPGEGCRPPPGFP